jgi:hypothetical protein
MVPTKRPWEEYGKTYIEINGETLLVSNEGSRSGPSTLYEARY